MEHAYWGPHYSDDEIGERIEHRREALTKEECQWGRVEPKLLLDRAATAIAEGNVVGWFQGRMEWGSRALGESLDPLRSAPRGYEGDPECKNQASRRISAVCSGRS